MRFNSDLEKKTYYKEELEYCYFCLRHIQKTFDKKKSLIDLFLKNKDFSNLSLEKAEFLKKIETIEKLVSTIIKCKKQLDYEVDDDKQFLKTVRNFKKNIKKYGTTN